MLDHQTWANKQLLAAMRDGQQDNKEALRLFRHVAIAEQVWMTRLSGESSAGFVLWSDDADLAAIEELLADNARRYEAYVDGLTEERLDDIVTYANQSGVQFRTSIRDILTHVSLHGQYHRGQINRAIRQSDGTPAGLDYIIYSRLTES
ncbi:DinB family protein [Cohnella sp. GCM10027633]|uniref:DinB family protein n=1 Tax=unclassified Cohnella TaxID=2636738 RepID=UPI00362941BE